MDDKISVIIPIYKVEKYLHDCIDSVINQTYKNLEIILVDDGSPDNCGKICDEYAQIDSRINVIHKKNAGLASARNSGKDIATGDWIYFLDSDDWIELDAMESALKCALDNHVDAVFFDSEKVYSDHFKKYCSFLFPESKLCLKNKRQGEIIDYMYTEEVWFGLYRLSIIQDINFKLNTPFAEDTVFKFEIYNNIRNYFYLSKVCHKYRMNNCSYIHSYYPNDYITQMNVILILKQISREYNYPPDSITYINSRCVNHFIGVSNNIFSKYNKVSFSEKKRQITLFIDSVNLNNALEDCKYELIKVLSGKLLLKLKIRKVNWLIAYLLHILSEIKNGRKKPSE